MVNELRSVVGGSGAESSGQVAAEHHGGRAGFQADHSASNVHNILHKTAQPVAKPTSQQTGGTETQADQPTAEEVIPLNDENEVLSKF